MYQLEYLDLEKNDKYEDVIKRVVDNVLKKKTWKFKIIHKYNFNNT